MGLTAENLTLVADLGSKGMGAFKRMVKSGKLALGSCLYCS